MDEARRALKTLDDQIAGRVSLSQGSGVRGLGSRDRSRPCQLSAASAGNVVRAVCGDRAGARLGRRLRHDCAQCDAATQEIGVRLALGAGGALVLGRLLSGFLVNTSPRDAATLTTVIGLLAGIALVASYLPARRATRVDPMVSLRSL